MDRAGFDTVQGAGQWLREGCRAKRDARRQSIEIQPHNARGDQQVFGIGTVEKEQVFAQAEQPASAKETLLAGSRIGHDHCISLHALCDPFPNGCYYSGYLVTEACWCPLEQNGMSTPQSLEISPARRCRGNL
jgi:hypothetical protein